MIRRATAWGAYKAIASTLRTRIIDGTYATGSPMPSESSLCAEFGVARNTLRRALDQLASEGLVLVSPGRGRVVATTNEPVAPYRPLYRVIAAELGSAIASGEFQPGDALPSESALAEQYGVSRGSARQALAELEGTGVIESVHGRGRFVRRS